MSSSAGYETAKTTSQIRWGLGEGIAINYNPPGSKTSVPATAFQYLQHCKSEAINFLGRNENQPWFLKNICVIAGWGAREGIIVRISNFFKD